MTIDYKALAERLSPLADERASLIVAPHIDDLRTVVSLLNGMADMEPAARIYTDAELVHRDPRWGRVCWIVPECEIDGGALLYLHPAPQPQPERQPVSEPRPCTCHPDDNPPIPCAQKYALSECRPEPTETQIEAAADALIDESNCRECGKGAAEMTEAEQQIREALPFATPGRWEHVFANGGREHYVYAMDANYRRDLPGPVKVAWLPYSPGSNRDANDAIYIAACNPENISALLAEIDRLTRERDEARAEREALAKENVVLQIKLGRPVARREY